MTLRSLLFAPATRPDLIAKLPRSRPDAVIIDLEDAVPPAHKEAARAEARTGAAALVTVGGPAVFVRVNAIGSPWFAGDVAQALVPGIAGIVVPKVETVDDVRAIGAAVRTSGHAELRLILGIESGCGVLEVERLLAPLDDGTPAPYACYFGAEDYAADIGARRTGRGDEVLYARSRVALVAAVHGAVAIDQVVVTIGDEAGFLHDAGRGRDLGYRGKMCIHPGQVPLANAVFAPSLDEVARSRRMITAAEDGAAAGAGALLFEGRMIDEPALREARALLDAAARIEAGAAP